MEVCSEHAAPLPEPVGERRTYSHRLVPAVCPQQVLNVCFMRMTLGLTLGSILTERSRCWVGVLASTAVESLTISVSLECLSFLCVPCFGALEGKAPPPLCIVA